MSYIRRCNLFSFLDVYSYETYTGIMPYYTVLSTFEIAYWRTVVRITVYRYSNFVTTTSENVRMSIVRHMTSSIRDSKLDANPASL
jgi:hypothetical protein